MRPRRLAAGPAELPYAGEHPSFSTDGLEHIRLWRYLSFSKFVDLLRTNTLYFSNLQSLAKSDSEEGLYTKADHAYWARTYGQLSTAERDHFHLPDAEHWKRMQTSVLGLFDYARSARQEFFVNCWHASEHENFAMWKIYAEESGVCIQTTFSRLKNSLSKQQIEPIYIGKVRYRDYTSQQIGLLNAFDVAISKRREFSYEMEVRAVASHFGKAANGNKVPDGISISVDTNTLIDQVFISPYAGEYVASTAADVLSRYGFSKTVQRSSI
jgi:hypothetical protein